MFEGSEANNSLLNYSNAKQWTKEQGMSSKLQLPNISEDNIQQVDSHS